MYSALISIFIINILLGFFYWFKRINDSQYELLGMAIFPYSFFIILGLKKIKSYIVNNRDLLK